MPDYSYLLSGSPPPQPAPNPLQAMGGVGNLAGLLQGVQMQGLQLSQQQNYIQMLKEHPEILSQFLGGQGSQVAPDMLGKYALGLSANLPGLLGMARTQAQTGLDVANTAKAQTEVQSTFLGRTADFANSIGSNATPQDAQNLWNQLQQNGYPPNLFYKEGMSPAQFFAAVGTGLQHPEARAALNEKMVQMWKSQADITREAALAGKQIPNVPGMPLAPTFVGAPGAQGVPQWGTATAPTAATNPLASYVPKNGNEATVIGKLLNAQGINAEYTQQGPNAPFTFGPNHGQPMAGAAPTAPNSQATQVYYSPQQNADILAGTREREDLRAKANVSPIIKSEIEDLRNLEAQGIFSGGVKGTPWFQKFANVMAAMNIPGFQQGSDNYKLLSNSQGWTPELQSLVAQAVRQFAGARVAARELPFFSGTKPDQLSTPEGRELTYRMVYSLADRTSQMADQADQWAYTPGHYGLTGFQPKIQETQMPPIKTSDKNPPPDPTGKKGWVWTNDAGVKQLSDGTQWLPLK